MLKYLQIFLVGKNSFWGWSRLNFTRIHKWIVCLSDCFFSTFWALIYLRIGFVGKGLPQTLCWSKPLSLNYAYWFAINIFHWVRLKINLSNTVLFIFYEKTSLKYCNEVLLEIKIKQNDFMEANFQKSYAVSVEQT